MTHAHDTTQRLARERRFHDQAALELSAPQLPLEPAGEAEQALFDAAGPLQGRRVLDLGCGSGDLTLLLMQLGAQVTALDLSPGMVELARQRAELHLPGRSAQWIAAPVEDSGLPSGRFDVVLGRFILHHLDLEHAAREISRLLVPGGRAVFLENSGRNPLLMLARDHVAGRFGVPRLGTADERPLVAADVQVLSRAFASVRLTYPIFEFLRLFDRQVLRFRWPPISRVVGLADAALGRLPILRQFSFRVLVTATTAP